MWYRAQEKKDLLFVEAEIAAINAVIPANGKKAKSFFSYAFPHCTHIFFKKFSVFFSALSLYTGLFQR